MNPQSSLQLALDIHWALVGMRAFPPAGGFVCSVSIMVALAMLMNGAGIGTPTHLELLRVLTAPDLQEHRAPTLSSPVNASAAEIHYNKYINSLTRSLRRHTNKTGTALLLANAIWSKKGPGGNTLFKPWYVRRVQGWFRAPSATVDDVAPLNAWAANVTHGLITEAVPRDLRFLLVLTNAVYFNGQWQYVFDKNLTEKAAFTTSSGVKEVDTMTLYVPPVKQHQRPVAVSSKPGVYSAIKLPYRNSTLSAVIILPDEAAFGVDVYAVMPQLHMEELLHNMSKLFKPVTPGFMLKLPKFDLRSAAMSLVKVLQASNVSVSFTPAAQFSRMSAESPLYVTEVLHSVAVVVNEQGTEAAAVTAVVLDRGDHGRLIVDRPFVFAVVDEALPDADADGSAPTVLFLGAVADPG